MKAQPPLTANQQWCKAALSFWVKGEHHLPKVTPFGEGIAINFYGDLSTWDFNRLTQLVLVAHAFAVRVEIASSGPQMVKIIAHARAHGDRKAMRTWKYHPNLAELSALVEEAKTWKLQPIQS